MAERDLIQLDTDEVVFEVKCKKCGSTDTSIKSDIRHYESCSTGSMDIVCNKCGVRQTIYEPC